jgi:hypothetical protein
MATYRATIRHWLRPVEDVHALGLTGAEVTNNAVNPAGTRQNFDTIKTYLGTTCGLNLPSLDLER